MSAESRAEAHTVRWNRKRPTALWTNPPPFNSGGPLNTSTSYSLSTLRLALHTVLSPPLVLVKRKETITLLPPLSSLGRANKLRDHGNWLRAVFVCTVCVWVCVRRKLEGWGGFTLHELMNFAVMIFKSRMIPAGINNYILVILFHEREWERAGCGLGWKIISWSMHITEWKLQDFQLESAGRGIFSITEDGCAFEF